jgi:N,N'-diacetyllegionaminate synthase
MKKFRIGRMEVGGGGPPAFWPDIDVYFKGNVERAVQLVEQIRAAGLGVVKAAALHDARICLDTAARTEFFVRGQGMVSERYRDIIERHVVGIASLRRIFGHVRDKGLDLVVSVYDDEGIALADEMDAAAIKIPSSNIVHAPLIRAVASTGRPMVIDTGRSSMAEIARAVTWARGAGAERLLLQHSPPAPPAPASTFHLRMMGELGTRFDVPYGLSDHHIGTEMLLVAVALGASVLEKGVCAEGTAADIDIAHALPASQLRRVRELIEMAHAALGNRERELPDNRPRPADRMGLVAARDLQAGEVIDLGAVRFAFPALGIPVEAWDEVAGRRLRGSVRRDEPVLAEHLLPRD